MSTNEGEVLREQCAGRCQGRSVDFVVVDEFGEPNEEGIDAAFERLKERELYRLANVIPDPKTVDLYKKYVVPALTWIGAAIVTALMMWYAWEELMIFLGKN